MKKGKDKQFILRPDLRKENADWPKYTKKQREAKRKANPENNREGWPSGKRA